MATAAPMGEIEIGRVLRRGFGALRGEWMPFTFVALVVAGLAVFASEALLWPLPEEEPDLSYLASPLFWGPLLFEFCALAFVQAVLARSMILRLGGRPADVRGSLVVALGLLPQLIGLTILTTIGVTIGLVLLVVPGILLSIYWFVAVPALVVERRGVLGSLDRSEQLTRGVRGSVFAVFVI